MTIFRVKLRDLTASRDGIPNAPALRTATDEVVTILGAAVIPKDAATIKKGLAVRKRQPSLHGNWGKFAFGNLGHETYLEGDAEDIRPERGPKPEMKTSEEELVLSLRSKGWDCTYGCTKSARPNSVTVRTRSIETVGITELELAVRGDPDGGTPPSTADLVTQATEVLSEVEGDDVPAIQAWLEQRRNGPPGGAYVDGWLVTISSKPFDGKHNGYELILDGWNFLGFVP